MQQRPRIDNNKLANLIVSKQLATREQIIELWPSISPSKDIGLLLVERGLLPEVIYAKILDFFNRSAASPSPPAASQPSSAPQTSPSPPTTDKGKIHFSGLSAANTLPEILAFARSIEASDVHLSPGNPVILRRYGILTRVTDSAMSADATERLIRSILSDNQIERFLESGDLEFVYTLPHNGRFRVTIMKQRLGWDFAARCIPQTIRSFEETGMPESCKKLTQWAQGLLLVTGPACCGKSSSLATLIEMINQTRKEHVIILESPIEYVFTPACAQITQREIGKDTKSQETALRAAMREDPDIIVVGELRDLATIQLAVTAAETGHLVFATMNTVSASRTIYRLIDSFPPEEQGIIRNMISESLRGVISQQLIPRKDGSGMVAAFEVLIINSAVANMIRKDEAHQLGTAMITGKASGMQLLDDSLRRLATQGIISQDEVAARCLIHSPAKER
jgi:twitching motility protein PilT